jgi:hypothetical protein
MRNNILFARDRLAIAVFQVCGQTLQSVADGAASALQEIISCMPWLVGRTRQTAERNYIVLKYQGKVPAMAGCEKCQRKFFTPASYSRDAAGAHEHLPSQFNQNECEEKPKKAHYDR